jgi:hypothetical protein
MAEVAALLDELGVTPHVADAARRQLEELRLTFERGCPTP